MSLDVLTAIWRNPPCKGGDLLCLLAIADNADENGYAWPSVATIARKAAMGERGAQKCIKKLSEMGLIRVNSGGGRNKTNAYQITTNGIGGHHKHQNPEQNTPNTGSPFTDENPEQSDINPEPAFAKPRTPVHPNSHKPSEEPPTKGRGVSFDEFWERCPQKQGKADCKSHWSKMTATDREQAFDALTNWYLWFSKNYPDATPLYPIRYLRKKRWQDEGWAGAQTTNDADRAKFWALSIIEGKYVSDSTCPPQLCREMIERGLVTKQQIEERGLVA